MDNYSYNTSTYPESGHSSPRSRDIDYENNPPPWDVVEPNQSQPQQNYKVKFMCSYGGKILPRPNDNQLSYIGGETKILAVDRNIKFPALLSKLISLCDNEAISFKYQLPGEDLDALISVTNDDDLEHLMHEHDRLYKVSSKPPRLRLFIFQNVGTPSLSSSARSSVSDDVKTEKERFVEALNSAPIAAPVPAVIPPASHVDLIFGNPVAPPPVNQPVVGRLPEVEDPIASDPIQKHIQDLQRLRIEEQQQQQLQQQQQAMYRRKSDDSTSSGEFYRATPPSAVHGGFVPASEAVYMVPNPTSGYPAPPPQMVRPGYYAVQRPPPDVYREQHQQQQQMYGVVAPPQGIIHPVAPGQPDQQQKMMGYTEGGWGVGGMVRPGMTEGGYNAQVAYDRQQVVYSPPVQAAPYHQVMGASAGVGVGVVASGEMRPVDAAGVKVVVTKATQGSL